MTALQSLPRSDQKAFLESLNIDFDYIDPIDVLLLAECIQCRNGHSAAAGKIRGSGVIARMDNSCRAGCVAKADPMAMNVQSIAPNVVLQELECNGIRLESVDCEGG